MTSKDFARVVLWIYGIGALGFVLYFVYTIFMLDWRIIAFGAGLGIFMWALLTVLDYEQDPYSW